MLSLPAPSAEKTEHADKVLSRTAEPPRKKFFVNHYLTFQQFPKPAPEVAVCEDPAEQKEKYFAVWFCFLW